MKYYNIIIYNFSRASESWSGASENWISLALWGMSLQKLTSCPDLDTKFSSRPSVFACWLFLPVTCMLVWLILHRYTVNALQRPSIEHVIHVGVYQRGGMARLVSYDGVEEVVVGTDYTHVASHNDKVGYKNRAWNYYFFQGAQLHLQSYFKLLCIEASTYLGSLQKFEGDAEEFKRALGSWLKLIYSPGQKQPDNFDKFLQTKAKLGIDGELLIRT